MRTCWRRPVFDPSCRKSLSLPNAQKMQAPCGIELAPCGSVKAGSLAQFDVSANTTGTKIQYQKADERARNKRVEHSASPVGRSITEDTKSRTLPACVHRDLSCCMDFFYLVWASQDSVWIPACMLTKASISHLFPPTRKHASLSRRALQA
jgi:hypothetical protein